MKQEAKEFREILEDYLEKVAKYGLKHDKVVNHWLRRCFRLYIDGSYTYPFGEEGYEHYKKNIRYIQENKSKIKKLENLAVREFIGLIQVEFGLSPSTIVRMIKQVFTEEELKKLNLELIDDLLDLIRG